jgi:hypothetical protein
MIPAEVAVSKLRRDLAVSSFVKGAMLLGAIACLLVAQALNLGAEGTMVLVSLTIVWLVLSRRSARISRGVMDAPSLIASGRFEDAEHQLDEAVRVFSLFRTVKLLSLHHLSMLRHAQKRWQESVLLCRALQGQKLGGLAGLLRPSRLILADSLLQLGDLNGAYQTLSEMYRQRLTLGEATKLLVLQLDYESRVGAWQNMISGAESKVQLSELMNTRDAAMSQALLALAAKKTGKEQWSEWLKRRAELLIDPKELISRRAILEELFSPSPDNPGEGRG